MNIKQLFSIITAFFILKGSLAIANEPFLMTTIHKGDSVVISIATVPQWKINIAERLFVKNENPKLVALTLAVLLGAFGVHRLYLGTHPKVPVVYTLTFGGGFGLITLTDIVAIIITKDLSNFQDNPHVIMWKK